MQKEAATFFMTFLLVYVITAFFSLHPGNSKALPERFREVLHQPRGTAYILLLTPRHPFRESAVGFSSKRLIIKYIMKFKNVKTWKK